MLKRSSNVFDLDWPVEKDASVMCTTFFFSGWSVVGGEAFSIRVRLPARLQKFADLVGSKGGAVVSEEFYVVSSGSLFAAFVEVKDYPVLTYIGQEYRELVKEEGKKGASFSCDGIGPTPIHPDLYVVRRVVDGSHPSLGPKVYVDGQDVLIVVDGGSRTSRELVLDIFRRVEGVLLFYYLTLDTNHFLLDYQTEIMNRFAELAVAVRNLAVTKWWNVRGLFKHARLGRSCLSSVYLRLVEYEAILLGSSKESGDTLRHIGENEILSTLKPYFDRNAEPISVIPQSFGSALQHFEAELQGFRNIHSLVTATLAGAALGALLAALLGHYF